MIRLINRVACLCILSLLTTCEKGPPQVFKKLASAKTGIHFNNRIDEDDQVNVYNYMNIYTGAGVAAGDIDNDGLADLFFSGNVESSLLYLNKGQLKFEDITAFSGIQSEDW